MKMGWKRLAGGGLATTLAVAAMVYTVGTVDGIAARQALKNTSLTRVREQALTMFPRGSQLRDASSRLVNIGFLCEPLPHFLPDTSAPSLQCSSNGRGYPDYPAVNVTVLTRNGLVSDIEIWNVMARADGQGDDIDSATTGSITDAAMVPDLAVNSRPDPNP